MATFASDRGRQSQARRQYPLWIERQARLFQTLTEPKQHKGLRQHDQ